MQFRVFSTNCELEKLRLGVAALDRGVDLGMDKFLSKIINDYIRTVMNSAIFILAANIQLALSSLSR